MFDPAVIPFPGLRCIAATVVVTMTVMSSVSAQPMPTSPQALAQAGPSQPSSPQAVPEPPSQQSEPPSSSEPRKENPGLLNEIGKLFEKPSSILPALKSPQETIDDLSTRARDATKDASDALSRLAKSPGVSGRVKCSVAANGAPDCKAAADKLCQSKGFKEGKGLETDSTRNCSAVALLSGRKPDESECRTDNYVTRAICQ
jgi:hypothetical protein